LGQSSNTEKWGMKKWCKLIEYLGFLGGRRGARPHWRKEIEPKRRRPKSKKSKKKPVQDRVGIGECQYVTKQLNHLRGISCAANRELGTEKKQRSGEVSWGKAKST